MLKIYPEYSEPSIAITLNVHTDPILAIDTLESIKIWATDNVIMVVDKKGWDKFENFQYPDLEVVCGAYHGVNRSPYKNVAIGLNRIYEKWTDLDWYGYIEFDVLFLSSLFKADLARFAQQGCAAAGFEVRSKGSHTEDHWLVCEILNKEDVECRKMLGAVMFYTNDCMRQLVEANFYTEILERTKDYKGAKFPRFHDYAVEEVIFPTAGSIYGALGNFDRAYTNRSIYPVRFCPNVRLEETSAGTSIAHPVKKFDNEVRIKARKIRKELKC